MKHAGACARETIRGQLTGARGQESSNKRPKSGSLKQLLEVDYLITFLEHFHLGQCPLQPIQCRNAVTRFYPCHVRRKKFSEGLPCIVLFTLWNSLPADLQKLPNWNSLIIFFPRTWFSLLPAFSHSLSFVLSLQFMETLQINCTLHIDIPRHICVHTRACRHTHTRTHARTHARTHTHTHTHTYTHTRTHTNTPIPGFSPSPFVTAFFWLVWCSRD